MKKLINLISCTVLLSTFFLFSCSKLPVPHLGGEISTELSVSNIEPTQGESGSVISLFGSRFSDNESENTVKFNGIEATVINASESQLMVSVPEGLSIGTTTISISVNGETVEADESFSVVPYNSTGKHKVLLVGIDGLQYSKIDEVDAPNLQGMYSTEAFTGGITGTATEQETLSGPGWMSVLTGTWVDKHGVNDNSNGSKSAAKSVFTYIKESNPNAYTASIINWKPIHEFLDDQVNDIDYTFYAPWEAGGNSAEVITDEAISQIMEQGPDLTFVLYEDVDEMGHQDGFGGSYNNSIEKLDIQLGRLQEAVRERKKEFDENWLIIVTTDHGREISGVAHGGQSESEKTVFIKMNKEGNQAFNNVNLDVPDPNFNGIYGYPGLVSVASTILRHLFIGIDSQWELSGPPMIGIDGPRNVMFKNGSQKELYWYSESNSNAVIYKSGVKIATVPATQGGYVDTDDQILGRNNVLNYTVNIDGSTGTISKPEQLSVIASMPWHGSETVYLFRNDGKYVLYRMNDKTFNGARNTFGPWPGITQSDVDLMSAAFRWGDVAYIFRKDGTYLRYNQDDDRVDDGYPRDNGAWGGLSPYGKSIVATITWNDDWVVFCLDDGNYLLYSMSEDKVISGPRPIGEDLPGMEPYSKSITTAFTSLLDDDIAYFFLNNGTYVKFSKSQDIVLAGYPKTIDGNWPGVLE